MSENVISWSCSNGVATYAIVTAAEVLKKVINILNNILLWISHNKNYFVKIENFSVESVTPTVLNINFSTAPLLWTLFQSVWEITALNVFVILHLEERHTKATYVEWVIVEHVDGK